MRKRVVQQNTTSAKRDLRRAYGWPSGRQWRKIRKELRREAKAQDGAK